MVAIPHKCHLEMRILPAFVAKPVTEPVPRNEEPGPGGGKHQSAQKSQRARSITRHTAQNRKVQRTKPDPQRHRCQKFPRYNEFEQDLLGFAVFDPAMRQTLLLVLENSYQ